MLYQTKVALLIKGDRIEKGTEIDLTPDEVAGFDPADITALEDIPVPEEETAPEVPVEEMNLAQLRDRAKELGLSAGGSKADIEERIRLHLTSQPEEEENGDPEMIDYTVTQEDLDNNPELIEEGIKVGDVIQLPAKDEEEEELSEPNQ